MFANPPTVVTEAASSVTQTSATLNATVNPNGRPVSECHFEYGTTTAYGSSVPCSPLAGIGRKPGRRLRGDHRPDREHHLPLQDLRHELERHELRLGPDVHDAANPPTVVTEAASSVTQTSATLNATREPQRRGSQRMQVRIRHDHRLRLERAVLVAAGVGDEPGRRVRGGHGPEPRTPPTTSGSRRRTPGGTSNGSDQTFKTLPNPPTVVTEAASAVTQTSATLNATVNPNGGEVSECKLEYGTTTAYGSSAPCTPSPGSGSSPVAVSAAVTGLTANTTYHFRISATNAGGTSNGSDQTFKTLPNPPTVVTEAASSITQTTATLNATVNPNGGEVSECKFEYGTTTSYGSSAPCTLAAGVGISPVAVSAAITGLDREHHLPLQDLRDQRGGTSKGSDQTFKTLPNPPTVVTGSGVVGHADVARP